MTSTEVDVVDTTDQQVSGHAARVAPWAMQLVVLVEKGALPDAGDVFEAASIAVARLLSHRNAADDGRWRPALDRFHQGRIGKIVRRARGAAWDRLATLDDQLLVTHRSAQVRVFVPGPTDQMPGELARLQVAGLRLARTTIVRSDAVEDTAAVSVAVNPALTDLAASTGKIAAQCGHAANVAWLRMDTERRARWVASGCRVSVVHPTPGEWPALAETALVRIDDAGLTEIPPGTTTTIAWW